MKETWGSIRRRVLRDIAKTNAPTKPEPKVTTMHRFCVISPMAGKINHLSWFPTADEAVKYAQDLLGNKPSLDQLYVVEVVKIVECAAPPVVVRDPE